MKFTKEQLKMLASIVADAGQVFLASIVVPFFVNVDRISFYVLLSGLALTITCWIMSVRIAKGKT